MGSWNAFQAVSEDRDNFKLFKTVLENQFPENVLPSKIWTAKGFQRTALLGTVKILAFWVPCNNSYLFIRLQRISHVTNEQGPACGAVSLQVLAFWRHADRRNRQRHLHASGVCRMCIRSVDHRNRQKERSCWAHYKRLRDAAKLYFHRRRSSSS